MADRSNWGNWRQVYRSQLLLLGVEGIFYVYSLKKATLPLHLKKATNSQRKLHSALIMCCTYFTFEEMEYAFGPLLYYS